MSAAAFDKKFGAELVSGAPTAPGVYRYLSAEGQVLYVGKAKNLRRRLSNYRAATRKKVHRKMRTLVREAASLIYEEVASEEEALLREGELIRELKPPYNVEGAYAFLYPSMGVGTWDKHLLLCFSTKPEEFQDLGLSWYGCFRSRPRVKAAFDALVELLSLIGHREKSTRLPPHPRIKGSRLVGLRQVPIEVVEALPWFFAGDEANLPGEIARLLLGKARARRDAAQVEEQLKLLMAFYQMDVLRLRAALRKIGKPGSYVSQDERDALFIRAQFSEEDAAPG
jgi:excinuclease ABC subunit C